MHNYANMTTFFLLGAYNSDMNKTTNSERVMRSNAALVARGGRRMPAGYLQPDVASALAHLVQSGYAVSPVAAICRAILDAAKKMKNN